MTKGQIWGARPVICEPNVRECSAVMTCSVIAHQTTDCCIPVILSHKANGSENSPKKGKKQLVGHACVPSRGEYSLASFKNGLY